MSVSSPYAASPSARSSGAARTIAFLFSEALTAVLRIRYGKQTVGGTQSFREQMRRLLQTAMQESRALGYTSTHIQMAVLATVGFLDESVLNLASAAPADWARRPMQEELFGGHTAGETFFQNFSALLREENSTEVADVLELHCHCLMLGYKGRYAFGNTGELAQLLHAAQEKIARARGRVSSFLPDPVTLPMSPTAGHDRWSYRLMIATMVLAGAVIVCFALYTLSLKRAEARLVQNKTMTSHVFRREPFQSVAAAVWPEAQG
jgi:type VI secretion system protein ImpK